MGFESACSNKDGGSETLEEIETPSGEGSVDEGFVLQASMKATDELVGKDYKTIHNFMRSLGWDYSEHPNSSDSDHNTGKHIDVLYDEVLKQYYFKFLIHCNEKVLDGDRGSLKDRQRNEMKTRTGSDWVRMNGNWGEIQRLKWKFRIPKGFRPTSKFCHIHQIKAQEGNNGSPVITITPRSNSNGSNCRVQVIHNGDVSSTTKGTIIDNLPLSEFEGEWIQVTTEALYTHNGTFYIKMERLRDGKVLVEQNFENIDMWRKGATNLRSKFGLYRSYGKTITDLSDRPDNGLKDETLDLADFEIHEKNTNENPQPHD
jgi:hypothetical protein